MTAITAAVTHPGTQQYMSSPNTIAGGSDPQDPGATGSRPRPKHVAIHRLQFIGPKHYQQERAKSKGNTRAGSFEEAQPGHESCMPLPLVGDGEAVETQDFASLLLQKHHDPAPDGDAVIMTTEAVNRFDDPLLPQVILEMLLHQAMLIGKAADEHLAFAVGHVVKVDRDELLRKSPSTESSALRQKGPEASFELTKFRTDGQEPAVVGECLARQAFASTTWTAGIAILL